LQDAASARRKSRGPWPGHIEQPFWQLYTVAGVITLSDSPAIATTVLKTEQGV
jgi:hypothetical protein